MWLFNTINTHFKLQVLWSHNEQRRTLLTCHTGICYPFKWIPSQIIIIILIKKRIRLMRNRRWEWEVSSGDVVEKFIVQFPCHFVLSNHISDIGVRKTMLILWIQFISWLELMFVVLSHIQRRAKNVRSL